jgi:methylglutaconyl-CoA hydratase
MQADGQVNTVIANHVATVTFSHPKSNSLPGSVLSKLAASVQALGGDQSVRVVVLRSEGEGPFCAGASFDELRQIRDGETGRAFFMGFANVILAMRAIPQIVVARIQGKTVGGGVGLAAAADYALATTAASIKLSELAVGIGPFVVGPVIERKIGVGPMSALALDVEWRDAAWAAAHGLYAKVLPTIAELDQATTQLTTMLAASNPAALTALKQNFWRGSDYLTQLLPERAAISGSLILSEFSQHALQSK